VYYTIPTTTKKYDNHANEEWSKCSTVAQLVIDRNCKICIFFKPPPVYGPNIYEGNTKCVILLVDKLGPAYCQTTFDRFYPICL